MKSVQRKFGTFLKRSENEADVQTVLAEFKAVDDMLDRVLAYVRSVLAGEVKGDATIGRYLMDTFGASTEELEKGAFNTSLQVCCMLHYIRAGLTHVG